MSTLFNGARYFLRSPHSAGPSLGLAQSYWALQQRPLSMAEAVAEAWEEGYYFFEAGLREERLSEIRSMMKQTPVRLIAQGFAETAADAEVYFQRAIDLGAEGINLHLGHAYLTHDEAVDLVHAVEEQASRYHLPLLLETHRGRATQDLFRTSALVPHLRSASLVLDISHYLVAGEGTGGSEEKFRQHLEPLLTHTAMIHGRVSNGQSVQVLISSPFAATAFLKEMWQHAMSSWLADAPQDAIFVFEPELGPPPYAYVMPDGTETFDRAAQSRVLTDIAREAWAAACRSQGASA